MRRLGSQVCAVLEARGWNLPARSVRTWRVVGRRCEGHLGDRACWPALAGFVAPTC